MVWVMDGLVRGKQIGMRLVGWLVECVDWFFRFFVGLPYD